MVTNYSEWKAAVTAEHKKLVEVRYYLNDDGKERLRVFDTLGTLSSLCRTPDELLAWLDSREDFDESDVSSIESDHARLAIKSLRNIVRRTEMYVLNDDRCNVYTVENGSVRVTRTGSPTVFYNRNDAREALEAADKAGYIHAYIEEL